MKKIFFSMLWLLVFVASSCGKTKTDKTGDVDQADHEKVYHEKKSEMPKAAHKEQKKVVPVEHQAHLTSGWYSKIPTQLNAELDDYFARSINQLYVEADPDHVRALIVPHAGYYYSGLCAATAYQTLLRSKNLSSPEIKNNKIDRVIILAPSHRVFLHGVALPDYTSYKTMLGTIPTDAQSVDRLARNDLFKVISQAHDPEHAIEMQLLLLQKSIEKFEIIPLVVGHLKDRDFDEVAKELKKIMTPSTLVVVSSDFMHHGIGYEYDVFKKNKVNQIRLVDSLAVEAIVNKSSADFEKVLHETKTTICGQSPIRILLRLIEMGALGAVEPRVTCYYTSAHLKQARYKDDSIDLKKLLAPVPDENVQDSVSYVGIIFTQQKIADLKKENQLTGFEKLELVSLARQVIDNELQKPEEKVAEHLLWPIMSPGVEQASGAFVTLTTHAGALRGCIGQILSQRPLYQTVLAMSKAAALNDTRFAPVKLSELKDLVLDVTILAPPHPVASFNEIVLGVHGIILKKFKQDGTLEAHAVFLPQVPTEYGWDLRTTLTQLSVKAGLGPDGWKQGCEFEVFEGFEIKEE